MLLAVAVGQIRSRGNGLSNGAGIAAVDILHAEIHQPSANHAVNGSKASHRNHHAVARPVRALARLVYQDRSVLEGSGRSWPTVDIS